MAGKFKIFCENLEEDNQSNGPSKAQVAPVKREPLGLRQPLAPTIKPEPIQTTGSTTGSSTSASQQSGNDEDQENDISMASLGSDFVPSILNDDDQFDSFEVEEEDYLENGRRVYRREDRDLSITEQDDYINVDSNDEESDIELSYEDLMELNQAFKQHDESQLFKSTVYIEDIQAYLTQLERNPDLRPLPNYMDLQEYIDSQKRTVLINWLFEVADEQKLEAETLFICVGIIDRFLSKMSISIAELQLLGIAAMFTASKYEEIYPPNLCDFVEVTDETYTGQQICRMEQDILKTLNFRISMPTTSFFLRQIFAFNKFTKKVYFLAEYLCHLSLLEDYPFLEYYTSDIALAAVILAAHQLDAQANISTELQAAFDQSNTDQLDRRNLPKGIKMSKIDRRVFTVFANLPFCIEALRSLQEVAYKKISTSQTDWAICLKYSQSDYNSVALLEPLKSEDLFSILI